MQDRGLFYFPNLPFRAFFVCLKAQRFPLKSFHSFRDLLSEEDLTQSLAELKSQKTEVDESLKQLREQLADRMSPEQWLTDIEGLDKPRAELEQLLRKAVKKVTVWREKITVDTCKGTFTLPIKRIWHSRLLPHPHQLLAQDDNDQWTEDLVYCFGEDLPRDFEKKMKLLLFFRLLDMLCLTLSSIQRTCASKCLRSCSS